MDRPTSIRSRRTSRASRGSRRATVAAGVAAALLAVCAPAPAVASAPPGTPAISEPPVFDAPAGGKGGIQNPFVHCHSDRIEPRAVMAIVNPQSRWLSIHRWRGALPGVRFPRLWPGTYKVETDRLVRATGARPHAGRSPSRRRLGKAPCPGRSTTPYAVA